MNRAKIIDINFIFKGLINVIYDIFDIIL